MESKAPTNALVRTTTAATMIHGGIKVRRSIIMRLFYCRAGKRPADHHVGCCQPPSASMSNAARGYYWLPWQRLNLPAVCR